MQKQMFLTVLMVCAILACAVSVCAQTAPSSSPSANLSAPPTSVSDRDVELLRQDLRSQRKEITAQYLPLTPDEATKFWPLFDQYRKEAIKPNDARWALIKDYATNYNTITDAQAQDYIKRASDIDQQLAALRMKYIPLFEKVISPKKTAIWFQIDRRIDLAINLQLSAVIPMVNASQ